MAKLIKGDNVQNIITDGDVIVTSPSKIGKTLDEVLSEQQSDIDRLKSNVKYIYAYGGVGGSGSGGGSGSTEKPISVLITLNGVAVNNGSDAIILDGKGKYKLYIKVSNAGGKNLFVGYTTNGSTVTDTLIVHPLNGDNKYKREFDIDLEENGVLNIALSDDEGNNIGYYSQEYIVDSDVFNVTLNYIDINGDVKQYTTEPYECFVSDPNRKNRYFKLDYSIFLPEYSDVNIKCEIDGIGVIYEGSENKDIPIEGENCEIFINNEPILQNKYMGTYTLKATLSYKITGREVVRTRSFLFSIVPSDLYINVRTAGDVLYDDIELLKSDIKNGKDGIPYKHISQGSSLMMYCKVFEGVMSSIPSSYNVVFNTYDAVINDNGDIIDWNKLNISESDQLTEQIESVKGVSVTFPTGGIKQIKITTKGTKGDASNIDKEFYKYVFVKSFKSECDWFDSNRYNVVMDSYFRSNQGSDTYQSFPTLSSGDGVLSLTTSSKPIELVQSNWGGITDNICTVITFGIQVSDINSENVKIVDIYTTSSTTDAKYPLRTTRLFTNVDSEINKIAIPTEILNKNDNSQYHLVQIIRNLSDSPDGVPVFEDSLYIDGLIESVDRSTYSVSSVVNKLVLNNINICYNLINIQYFSPSYTYDGVTTKFNPDTYAYQYWLSYKEKYVNSGSNENRLTEGEIFIKENMNRILFDGTNVVVDSSIIMDIANRSELPTVVFSYDCENGSQKSLSEFMELMWAGRPNGDTTFGSRKIDLYWIPAGAIGNMSEHLVNIPSGLKDNTNNQNITGTWEIDLQGTSTMRNRIKNYSLRIKSESQSGKDKILFSPKFDIKDNKTFLPDIEWTIKADIADSAHANNTSIGKFVNDVCTKIDTNIPDATEDAKKFVKNTLEGIPVLLYFMCTGKDIDGITDITKIYYFGIYNFNLGRNSYYNLGYTGGIVDEQENRSDFMRVFYNIQDENTSKYFKDKVFTFAVGEGVLSPNIAVGEIQDNYPEFDFHQFDETLLFKKTKGNNACMFGDDSKITATDIDGAQTALQNLVKGVAKAGKFCFERVGRVNDFVPSREFTIDDNGEPVYGYGCINRYNEKKIPHPKWQKKYNNISDEFGSNIEWYETEEDFDNVSDIDLKKLITTYTLEDGNANKPILNFTSASEYYTICMAFGMVDSVLKNMNLKNFRSKEDGYNFHCAFYDMDCALEEANDGEEKISYLAATDYWYSKMDEKNKVGEIIKENDYWDSSEGGKGFDFTSSYLFAVIKYAKPIFESLPDSEEKYESNLFHYPQNFWAALRNSEGALRSADYFINNYFKSGITSTFEYLASLNYRVKYLYHGQTFDSNDKPIEQYLANAAAFNGSRKIKVKNWLTKRLRFIDVMMNVNGLHVPVYNDRNLLVPGPGNEYKDKLSDNNDITILHSAFDNNQHNTALSNFSGEVEIYAPKHTPFIFRTGTDDAKMYLLPGGVDKPNLIFFENIGESIAARFYGSGMFNSVNKIESMFTQYKSIISDNIEKITYGGSKVSNYTGGFTIDAKSVREIKLDIENMGGELLISDRCISLMKINIAKSGFYGNFQNFPNLQYVNISGVNSLNNGIVVSGSDYLTGENFIISGVDEKHKTTLNLLDITGVTGKFICNNTNIEDIRIKNNSKWDGEDSDSLFDSDFNTGDLSEFSISGDTRLKNLSLVGFRKVSIESCNNLENLSIDGALEEIYIDLMKIGKDEVESKLDKISLGSEGTSGVFDFTNYPNLKRVTLKNCDKLVHVKLPDRDIETDGMSNNINLKWIDTGVLPAFRDTDNKTPVDGYIEGVGDYENVMFPIYPNGSKLILCSDGAFSNCPNYNMVRSDWNKSLQMIGNGNYIAYTNISVSESCTSLENTFYMSGSSTNSEDDAKFNMNTAIRFIETCVPDSVKKNITSLSGCFKGRKDIIYTNGNAASDYRSHKYSPKLDGFTSLTNISGMYENTGVTFISKQLLSLPATGNNPENGLAWNSFIKSNMSSGVDISSDALENISYRLETYSGIKFIIYEYDEISTQYKLAGELNKLFDICKFFYHTKTDDIVLPYSDITSINSLNFGDQYIDFSGMFNLFPNVKTISNFLNGNLGKYNIDGLLRPCKNITSISNSFNDDYINNSTQVIDLYNFFNWDENITEGVTSLFEGQTSNSLSNGFRVNKTITYNNFKKVLEKIVEIATNEKNKDFKRLTNIFSYCTITEYNNEEIKFETEKTLDNIINISFLFENCTSDYKPFANSDGGNKGIYTGGVLNIGRSFFEKLPNFTIAQRTFANTYLSTPLTYDYFCKRSKNYKESDILLSENQSDVAKLYEYTYKFDISNLKECFYNTKFVNCKNWFDHNSESNVNIIGNRNYISTGDGEENKHSENGFVYYKYNVILNSYEKYILDNDVFEDCLDNYTDFISDNEIGDYTLYNHDLLQDFTYYGNIKDNMPFDPVNESNNNTIQKTYCCLPPDFLYGCNSTATIDSIFANSNIIGVIPRNLTKKINNQPIPNIFKNVNIMPNLEYYYDSEGGLDNSILNNITNIVEIESDSDIDNETYCVVFRDDDGMLKKRKPVSGDKNLGQFVYVPANFTSSKSLMNIFNFRYNLPKHWNMPIKPNGVNINGYKTNIDFNIANLSLEYHNQYYFTTDKSVKWENVRDAKHVFIEDNQDIDFSNKNIIGYQRGYYTDITESSIEKVNSWTVDVGISTINGWNNFIDRFYVDLNLCGRKNAYNMIGDYGCPISIKNREVYLDNFVSGILTIFLNGRVFDDSFAVNDLTTANHKNNGGSYVIGYYGLGKNIILPKYSGSPLDDYIVFIPVDQYSVVYYDFMINDNEEQSIVNYKEYINERININTGKNKYTFKPQ